MRGWPSESNAPALISDSTARLLSTGSGTRSAKSWKLANGPLLVALGEQLGDEPGADVAHRGEPERDRARAAERQGDAVGDLVGRQGGEVGDRPVDVGRQHPDAEGRHSAMYTAAFSSELFTLVSRQARYSTG